MSTKEQVLEEVKIEELLGNNHVIILFNDDVNTFDHVIDTLVRVCKHEQLQTEQCAMKKKKKSKH